MKCDHCNGTGKEPDTNKKAIDVYMDKKLLGKTNVCTKCWGDGQLDWVEVIVGKKIKAFIPDNTIEQLYPVYPVIVDYIDLLKPE